MNSVLLLDKKAGESSFKSLFRIKKLVDKKAGHAGTLDPFATGLMIVLTNRFTRLTDAFSNLDKTYNASFLFGSTSTTLDPEGEITSCDYIPSIDEIKKAINEKFLGEINQKPPIFSAIHIDGKRAYDLARKKEEFEIPSRKVRINSFDIISYEDGLLKCSLDVSKGTYIRSIARDLGLATNSLSFCQEIRRVKIGPLSIDDIIDVDGLNEEEIREISEKNIRKVIKDEYFLSEKEYRELHRSGRRPKIDKEGALLIYNSQIVSVILKGRLMFLL